MNLSDPNLGITGCTACPRLRQWCESIATIKRTAFLNEVYWGLPVPDFGDVDADRLIVGLAPAAHGANRTGRMFTGDRSGDWLYRALYKAGIASQPTSYSVQDGLKLNGVLITAVAHCAPPDNKLNRDEISNCSTYLKSLLTSRKWTSILCLGSIAWSQTLTHLEIGPIPKFAHCSVVALEWGGVCVGSYHPSQQNTFTGRLTEPMLDAAVELFSSHKSSELPV